MNDDEALEAFVRKATIGVWHASCSCRMGLADDPMAVVDNQGRVKGVQGLRVVDASIFPVVPCANTNLPTPMSAEKIAAAMQCPVPTSSLQLMRMSVSGSRRHIPDSTRRLLHFVHNTVIATYRAPRRSQLEIGCNRFKLRPSRAFCCTLGGQPP